ncbi:MAG: DUF4304 domain-containing protein [bacterium]|nr:DUF4304 domain-containing protein [bacterium]
MAQTRKEIRSALAKEITALLRKHGFRRTGMSWRRVFPEVVQVINLQSLPYGGQSYLNIGVLLRSIRDDVTTKHYQCNIHARLENQVSEVVAPMLKKALYFEDPELESAERLAIIKSALEEVGLPYCDAMTTEADIRATLVANRFSIIAADIQSLTELGLY